MTIVTTGGSLDSLFVLGEHREPTLSPIILHGNTINGHEQRETELGEPMVKLQGLREFRTYTSRFHSTSH